LLFNLRDYLNAIRPLGSGSSEVLWPFLGAVVLAADKGALCLTLSAFDTLPEYEFAAFFGITTF
jgi:hypothetical protein